MRNDTSLRALFFAVLDSYYGRKKQRMERDYVLFQWLYRPVSMPLTALLLRVGATANGVTAVSALVLIASVVLMSVPSPYAALGIAGYPLFYVLDFVDGNIARYRGSASYYGKLIDGFVDTLGFFVFTGAALYSANHAHDLFGYGIEIGLGLATTFGVMLRQNYTLRLALLKRESGLTAAGPADAPPDKRGLMRRIVWLSDNLAVTAPVLLPIAAVCGMTGVFVLLFFALHTIFGLGAVSISLLKNRRELASLERHH